MKVIGDNNSQATIDHHMRNLRTIINYFTHFVKIVPKEYEYPFGLGGFTISSYFPSKPVLKEPEIQSVIDLKEFKSKEHEFARDVWVLLYRCNGANFADLLRMKWSQINGDYIFFTNRNRKLKRQLNWKLKDISGQLKLSRPLKLGSARDCYASTLDRQNVPREKINQMLGHSNVVITEHYLDGLDPDCTFGINETIL